MREGSSFGQGHKEYISFLKQKLIEKGYKCDTKSDTKGYKFDTKTWNVLAINESLKEIFNYQPITAFRQNKTLKELIGSNKIEKNKVKKQTNTETMLSMPDKFKVTLLQTSTKSNYF